MNRKRVKFVIKNVKAPRKHSFIHSYLFLTTVVEKQSRRHSAGPVPHEEKMVPWNLSFIERCIQQSKWNVPCDDVCICGPVIVTARYSNPVASARSERGGGDSGLYKQRGRHRSTEDGTGPGQFTRVVRVPRNPVRTGTIWIDPVVETTRWRTGRS